MITLIKNGRIIDPRNKIDFVGAVLIENGKIKSVVEGDISGDFDEVIDASDMVVSPGFIDMHVHLREPGYEYKETIASGLAAAAAGGFAAVCPMPNTNPITDNEEIVSSLLAKAAQANGVKLYPIAAATKGSKGEALTSIGALKAVGAVAISDDGHPVKNSGLLRRVMEYASSFNFTYISHAEDQDLVGDGQMNEGDHSTLFGMPGVASVSESVVIARECLLAEYLGVSVHIAHVSKEPSVALIRFFKSRGVKVTAETTPHYLTLTDEALGSYDTNTKINPPIGSQKDREALIAAVADGVIDVVATDHAPHHEREKNVEFYAAPPGIVGLETAVALLLRHYHSGVLSLKRVVELLTKGYEILSIDGGDLSVGSSADITIFDPDYQWTIDRNMFLSKGRNTPFHGFQVKGAVFRTVVDGKSLYVRKY
ncbi:dihydroorotase [bacterium]|nr:dihydroorotase [bacterium]